MVTSWAALEHSPPAILPLYGHYLNLSDMKRQFLSVIFIAAGALILASGCKKDSLEPEEDPAAGLHQIVSGYAIGAAAKLELYGNGPLSAGYTPLFFVLYDSVTNQLIEDAAIELRPMMNMGAMEHSAPFENPANKAVDKLFPGSVTFIMATMEMGSWRLEITVRRAGKEGRVSVPVTVSEPPYSRVRSFVSKANGDKLIAAYIEPSKPKVGVNDMEIAIYRSQGMDFPADSSMTVTLTPEMPSMGHGSPNNVDPVHIGNGHYRGKVNFTMTGLWQLNLGLFLEDAVAADDLFFEVNF